MLNKRLFKKSVSFALVLIVFGVSLFVIKTSRDLAEDAHRRQIQQLVEEFGNDPAKWSVSRRVSSIVIVNPSTFKVVLRNGNVDFSIVIQKTLDGDLLLESGKRLYDGRDLRWMDKPVRDTFIGFLPL